MTAIPGVLLRLEQMVPPSIAISFQSMRDALSPIEQELINLTKSLQELSSLARKKGLTEEAWEDYNRLKSLFEEKLGLYHDGRYMGHFERKLSIFNELAEWYGSVKSED